MVTTTQVIPSRAHKAARTIERTPIVLSLAEKLGQPRRCYGSLTRVNGEDRYYLDQMVTAFIRGVPFRGKCPEQYCFRPDAKTRGDNGYLAAEFVKPGNAPKSKNDNEDRAEEFFRLGTADLHRLTIGDMRPLEVSNGGLGDRVQGLFVSSSNSYVQLELHPGARLVSYLDRIWEHYSAFNRFRQVGIERKEWPLLIGFDGFDLLVNGGVFSRFSDIRLVEARDAVHTEIVRQCGLSFFEAGKLPRYSFLSEPRSTLGALRIHTDRGPRWLPLSAPLTRLLSEWCKKRDQLFEEDGFLLPGGDGQFIFADPLNGQDFSDVPWEQEKPKAPAHPKNGRNGAKPSAKRSR